jgi:DNA-directed RNA polymerase alpha subunit
MLRVVEVFVHQTDQVDAAVRYKVEKLQSGQWHDREHVDVNAGTVGARRKFLLEHDERLIIEDISVIEAVWDQEQRASKAVVRGLPLPQPPEETEYSSQIGGDVGENQS